MPTIENVSDTARWVAYFRAKETARSDALFNDPFAARLAGPKGAMIAESLPDSGVSRAVVVRTVILDEWILDRINNHGTDLVLNLAAGLDARPWRMTLPPSLHWVDVDLPAILNYKTALLRDDRTTCRYDAITADLTQPGVADSLFTRLGSEHQRVLVITEGLLIYLTPENVAALGRALHAPPSFRWWLTDLASPRLLKYISRTRGDRMKNAPFLFGPAEGTRFFQPLGWEQEAYRSTILEARRLGRPMQRDWLIRLMSFIMPAHRRDEMLRMSGLVMLKREE